MDTSGVGHFRTPIFFRFFDCFATVFTFTSHAFHYIIYIDKINPKIQQFPKKTLSCRKSLLSHDLRRAGAPPHRHHRATRKTPVP